VSRIFEAMRQTEKANGKTPAGSLGGKEEQRPDLMASLEAWSSSDGPKNGAPPATPESGAQVNSKSGILEALSQLDSAPAKETFRGRVDSGEQWRDLAARISLPAEIVDQAEHVACEPRRDERVLASARFNPSAQESFRVLCQRLLQVREQRRLRTVLVTSPVPGEGKTVIAINLAATLARNSAAVLLVNADLRHPMRSVLGIDPRCGLSEYLAGRIELNKAIRRVDRFGLFYMPAGIAPANPSELLQKPALLEFMNQAAAAFDWVIVDSPSVNLFADSRHLATAVDGVLLVVRESVTPKELAQKSLAALDKAFIVGQVFNASTVSPYADYDHAYRSQATDEGETNARARRSKRKPAGDDSAISRVLSNQGGPRI
jgi:protein-tyrosine kinase